MALGYVQCLAWDQGVDGTALTNSTIATSILNAAAKWNMPGNYFGGAGAVGVGGKVRIRMSGRLSLVTTTPGTLSLTVKAGSVIVFAPTAISLNATAKTNVLFTCEMDLTVRAVGQTGAVLGTGWFSSEGVINQAVVATGPAPGLFPLPSSAPATGTAFDTSTGCLWDVLAQWSIPSASNSITVHNSTFEGLN